LKPSPTFTCPQFTKTVVLPPPTYKFGPNAELLSASAHFRRPHLLLFPTRCLSSSPSLPKGAWPGNVRPTDCWHSLPLPSFGWVNTWISVDACAGKRTAVPLSPAPSLETELSRLYATCDVRVSSPVLPADVVREMLPNWNSVAFGFCGVCHVQINLGGGDCDCTQIS